jgi:hypothetical protein
MERLAQELGKCRVREYLDTLDILVAKALNPKIDEPVFNTLSREEFIRIRDLIEDFSRAQAGAHKRKTRIPFEKEAKHAE